MDAQQKMVQDKFVSLSLYIIQFNKQFNIMSNVVTKHDE